LFLWQVISAASALHSQQLPGKKRRKMVEAEAIRLYVLPISAKMEILV